MASQPIVYTFQQYLNEKKGGYSDESLTALAVCYFSNLDPKTDTYQYQLSFNYYLYTVEYQKFIFVLPQKSRPFQYWIKNKCYGLIIKNKCYGLPQLCTSESYDSIFLLLYENKVSILSQKKIPIKKNVFWVEVNNFCFLSRFLF